ncbi:MAG: hypothetical protein JWL92_250 [Candidatus Nomurabacteria bacterium]|nr:hypothetical protein [Candidatus Nomurabacteria bacterium]
MKKTTLATNLKYILLGIIVAIGLSYAVQAAPSPIGSGNPDAPLNVGTTAQSKSGGLAVLAFNAKQNAQFDGSTFFHGALLAPSANSTISFGGTYNGAARNTGIAISGAFGSTGTIAAATLINGTNSTVCSDASGIVLLCDAAVVTPPPPTSSVHEFLATGSSSSSYTGFALGVCGSAAESSLLTNNFYNFFGTGTSCASHANGDDGSGNHGFVAQLDFSQVSKNTLSGFNGISGQIVRADYFNRPPSYWTVPAAGYYQVDISGNMRIETRLKDGNFLFVTGLFLRAEKGIDGEHQFTEYPITAFTGTGSNALLEGYDCNLFGPGKLSNVANVYFNRPGSYFNNRFAINSPQIQYAQMGSCSTKGGSSWVTPGAFGVTFHQSIYLNAGDRLYTFAKLAGVGYKSNTFSGGADPRDIDVFITQTSNSIHIVQQ